MKLNDRLDELKSLAPDEGIHPSEPSERSLRQFAVAFGEPLAVFLLENGNYRGRWHNDTLSSAIEFTGMGGARIIHLPRATPPTA